MRARASAYYKCLSQLLRGDTLRRFIGITAFLTLFSLAASCAAGPRGTAERTRSSRDPITIEEMQSNQSLTNAYEIAQRLRPRWLRTRGRASMSSTAPVLVFVDNVHSGGVDVLYSIPVERISEIRYIDPATATHRWGTGLVGGAIEVITVGSRPDN